MVQVVCECGGSRPDLPLGGADPGCRPETRGERYVEGARAVNCIKAVDDWDRCIGLILILLAGCIANRREAQPLLAAQSGVFRLSRDITHARNGSAIDFRIA